MGKVKVILKEVKSNELKKVYIMIWEKVVQI